MCLSFFIYKRRPNTSSASDWLCLFLKLHYHRKVFIAEWQAYPPFALYGAGDFVIGVAVYGDTVSHLNLVRVYLLS